MTNTDHAAKTPTQLEQSIEAERGRLLQIHSVLHCLYEVLLYAEGEEAATYAQAAHLAAMLVDDVAANLDAVKLRPMLEAIQRSARLEGRYEPPEPKVPKLGSKDDDNAVREPAAPYFH